MKRCLAALLALCALLSLCACGAAAPETDGGTFSLDILDTGKSDCIIVCMDGVTVVNDTADEDDFDSICAALERRGVQRIDYLVLSHYDKDHIGSAAALVRAYPVGQILGPDYEEDSMYLTLLKRAAEERNTPFRRLTENYTVETARLRSTRPTSTTATTTTIPSSRPSHGAKRAFSSSATRRKTA